MSVNGIGATEYPACYGTRKAESSTKGDFGASLKGVSGAKNVVYITPDALFSIYDAQTGESANVYRADDYSEENPLYLVKGMDKNGNEYEQTVDVSKVNPNSCSYTEMLALNAHTGNQSDSNFLSMAVMKDKAGTGSCQDKADYLSAAYALMNDMKTLGNWDGYLRYGKWINDILTFCKSKQRLLESDVEPLNHFRNERAVPDEEAERTDGQDSKTKTEIIVKPDGSRVLVMTVSIGGMETTMSLEISKPTKAPDENSKQDTDNDIPSADAEMNVVSDEMSNISTEA